MSQRLQGCHGLQQCRGICMEGRWRRLPRALPPSSPADPARRPCPVAFSLVPNGIPRRSGQSRVFASISGPPPAPVLAARRRLPGWRWLHCLAGWLQAVKVRAHGLPLFVLLMPTNRRLFNSLCSFAETSEYIYR